jgi:predicted ATPase
MITRIEALNFRCLRYISQPLEPFHVLVGPNASGKTTFLDVVNFVGTLLSKGIDEAVNAYTQSFDDLTWGRQGGGFELAIEARVPEGLKSSLNGSPYRDRIRYEVRIVYNKSTDLAQIDHERVYLANGFVEETDRIQGDLFPLPLDPPDSLFWKPRASWSKSIVTKSLNKNDNFYSEFEKDKGGWKPSFRLGPRKSAFGSLPPDETHLGISWWFLKLLTEGVQPFILNSQYIRKASPPGKGRGFRTDGSNLPWVVDQLIQKSHSRFHDWIGHLRTALPDLASIRVVERSDDKHKYLMLKYDSGLEIPSWMASDGTLRLLALTLPAYLPDFDGVYLIEEPENGIHPRAVETLFQSLKSVYNAQILLATHSPVILSLVEPHDVLCFAKTPDGQTDIVRGDQHPALRDWKHDVSLGTLLAAGVLG